MTQIKRVEKIKNPCYTITNGCCFALNGLAMSGKANEFKMENKMGKLKRVSMGILLAILFVIPFCLVPIITIPIPCIITSVSSESNKSSKNNPGKKSFKERMCSTITDFLEDKITTTKKGSNTSKILQGSLKEVNGLCGKGIIPQVSEIKGLSKKDKEILNNKTENALKRFYDGAGNLPDEDFDGIKTKLSKTGSGKPGTRLSGDTVTDLKSSDPTLPAASANSVPPLSLAQASSSQASNECKYTISSYLCEKSKREERIELIDKLISTKQDAINNYNYLTKRL